MALLSRDFCFLGLVLFRAGEVLQGLIWEGLLKRLGSGDSYPRKHYYLSHCFPPGWLHTFLLRASLPDPPFKQAHETFLFVKQGLT